MAGQSRFKSGLVRSNDLPYESSRPPIPARPRATRTSPAPLDKGSWYVDNAADGEAQAAALGMMVNDFSNW